jgi:hypothetical protein
MPARASPAAPAAILAEATLAAEAAVILAVEEIPAAAGAMADRAGIFRTTLWEKKPRDR